MSSFTKYIINHQESILTAIEKINLNGKRAILVANNKNEIIGLATDGDIRRALLKKINLNESITLAMNKKFKYFYSNDQIKNALDDESFIPVLNEHDHTINNIYFDNPPKNDLQLNSTPVLIMAGGFGKRLRPLTKDIPKPMLEISGIPLLEITINYLNKLGLKNIFISTYYLPDKIKNYFGNGSNHNAKITYLDEAEPSGTAGCLSLLPDEIKYHSLIVVNGDILTRLNFIELLELHNDTKSEITIGTKFHEYSIPYGILETNDGVVSSITEKPTIRNEISAGIYVINKSVITTFLKDVKYLDMPDLINMLLKKNMKISSFPIHEYWLDIGKKNDFDKAQNDLEVYFDEK